jgi:hypothetical protein
LSWIADQDFVRRQYEDEQRLAARKSAYANTEGPDPRELVWQAIVEVAPRRGRPAVRPTLPGHNRHRRVRHRPLR